MMTEVDRLFQEFVDAIWTVDDEQGFEKVARRVTLRLGFRWFAYLQITNHAPMLVSSYPKAWTGRYFELGYQRLDPVVRRARSENEIFHWGDGAPKPAGTKQQRSFFDEAMTFGIRSGVTVPIRGGYGQMAAFTMATDEAAASTSRLVAGSETVVHLVGLYFHAHAAARLRMPARGSATLTQRERQCLAWVARGKTVADIAVLVQISPRTVVFHLENARRKLDAATIAQCVGEALRRGLLP
ncbi:autoinducer binding domain-containing protein [Bradyrhizobium sp. B097]|uniref:autoinducer binding domain-containing protein n=1 Tax=Bradyrhizobium sp. B097 TaxID=3140244 RepID=UPI003183A61B